MLLALDAGNSNITIGAFDGRRTLIGAGVCAPFTSKPPMNGAS